MNHFAIETYVPALKKEVITIEEDLRNARINFKSILTDIETALLEYPQSEDLRLIRAKIAGWIYRLDGI